MKAQNDISEKFPISWFIFISVIVLVKALLFVSYKKSLSKVLLKRAFV